MSGTDANNGEMLSQEALDAMLAAMNPDAEEAFGNDALISDESVSSPSAGMGLESTASNSDMFAAPNPSLSFMSFGDTPISPSATNSEGFDRVQDISLEISVELGRTRLLIRDILDLTSGSIIELEKIAGEPVDLLANGLLIARGEVVVVEDSFGVRITQVITAGGRKEIANNSLHKSMI